MTDRTMDPMEPAMEPEWHVEQAMRPLNFDQFQGQCEIKEQLKVYIRAAQERQEPLDHILFSGPPGLGKTSLASIVARELGVGFRSVSAPAIEKPAKLAAILTNLTPKEILFIDEIHRLHAPIEELLYSAMEDCQLDIVVGEGPAAQTIKLNLVGFTLIGATTRAGLLSHPLRDRFGILQRLQFYRPIELVQVILQNARKLNFSIEEEAAFALAHRSRGTPRIANRLLRRARDVSQVLGHASIDRHTIEETLKLVRIDADGLDGQDWKLLTALVETFQGKAVGLASLSAILGEEKDTISEVIEPYLIQKGLIQRTPQGRVATFKAVQLLSQRKEPSL